MLRNSQTLVDIQTMFSSPEEGGEVAAFIKESISHQKKRDYQHGLLIITDAEYYKEIFVIMWHEHISKVRCQSSNSEKATCHLRLPLKNSN
jgi:hypothetical protein